MQKRALFLLLIAAVLIAPVFAGGRTESAAPTGSAPAAAAAPAPAYPTQPIRIIVPYAPGGGTDTHARMVVRALETILPVPIVVVNIGGAASAVGSREVLEAAPDGYTVLLNIVNIWTNLALGNTDFGPDEFEAVAEAGTAYLVEATGASSRYQSFQQVINDVRTNPGSVRIATNIGAITHFTSLGVQKEIGGRAEFNMVHIGDGAQRIANVLGNNVDLTIMSTAEAYPFYTSKEMRVLAVYAPQRVPGMDDVPTAIEQGLNYVQPSPYWFFMPKGTPADRVAYLADAIERAMQQPDLRRRLEEMTIIPSFKKGAELRASIKEQGDRLLELARVYNLAR